MNTTIKSNIKTRYSYDCSCYLNEIINKNHRKKTIDNALKTLSKKNFDAIICTGISGLVAGSVLSHALDKELIIIRKQKSSHSQFEIEGIRRTPINQEKKEIKAIIIDDFICSGETIKRIFRKIRETKGGKNIDILGGYFYGEFCNVSHSGSFYSITKLKKKAGLDF